MSTNTASKRFSHSIVSLGDPFEEYMEEALSASPLVQAIKSLYESIKSRSLAHLSIQNIPLEIQLPPYLDALIHVNIDDDYESTDVIQGGRGSADDSGIRARCKSTVFPGIFCHCR